MMNVIEKQMIQPDFDPKRIRKCELITIDGEKMIQFIATGDRHKMMRADDGSIQVIKLPEQGRDYRYGSPQTLKDAIHILEEDHFDGHKLMAQQIKSYIKQMR